MELEMSKVLVVFEGGSRGSRSSGYGSYAIVKDNRRTITRVEFGSGMTGHEAEYDTLITALEAVIRSSAPADIDLEIQSVSALVLNQLRGDWKAREARMSARRDKVQELLRQFRSVSLRRVPREQAAGSLSG
jgi:ribonuclease HI